MRLFLHDKYKSLQPFNSEELYPLTIITGKNGSGKSQLLDLISKKAVHDPLVSQITLTWDAPIRHIQTEGLAKKESVEIGQGLWRQAIDLQIEHFRRLGGYSKEVMQYILDNKVEISPSMLTQENPFLSNDEPYKTLILKAFYEIQMVPIPQVVVIQKSMEAQVVSNIFYNSKEKMVEIIQELIKVTGKKIIDLTPGDFYSPFFAEHLVDSNHLFSSRIELIFYNYANRRYINNIRYFEKVTYGKTNDAISDPHFIKRFPPPWEIINEILAQQKINFEFSGIIPEDFNPTINQPLVLRNKSIDSIVPFEDLSSGEKIILGVIIKLFTSEYYSNKLTFPELIVLDEPDAFLHPEMSKLLIDIFDDVFVKKYGIKVIFTTHSPSTVALAPESSLYELKNGKNSSLRKISKDYALNLLTSFIPTLSIDYKNHRQVFVESPIDVFYFQELYSKLMKERKLDHKLYFISNGLGKGNSTLVYNITKDLREAGSTSIFGIVDWDLRNEESSGVFVHGHDERYCIENFIFDPIYLAVLLCQMKAHQFPKKIGVNSTDNEFEIGTKDNRELQGISDTIFNEFETSNPAFKAKNDLVEIAYLNDKAILVPRWFLVEPGHSIGAKFFKTYSALAKFNGTNQLQTQLVTIMCKMYPFVPLTSIQLIEKISKISF